MSIQNKKISNTFFMVSLIATLLLFFSFADFNSPGTIYLVPGSSGVELLIITLGPFITVPIVAFLFYKLMIKIYPKIARRLKSKQYSIGYYNISRKKTGKDILNRAFMSSTFSMAIGLFLTQLLSAIDLLLVTGFLSPNVTIIAHMSLPLTTILIPPLRWSEDLGIIIYRDADFKEDVPEVTSVGEYISLIYKGFSGLTTPFLFIFMVIQDARRLGIGIDILAISLLPLSLLFYFIILEYIFDRVIESKKQKLLKKLNFTELTIKIFTKE